MKAIVRIICFVTLFAAPTFAADSRSRCQRQSRCCCPPIPCYCDDYCCKPMPCTCCWCKFCCPDYCCKPMPCTCCWCKYCCPDYCCKPMPCICSPKLCCVGCDPTRHCPQCCNGSNSK